MKLKKSFFHENVVVSRVSGIKVSSILLFPFYAFSVKYFFGNLRSVTRKRSQALAEVQGYLHERVSGMSVVKSFAIEDFEQKKFDQQNQNFLEKADVLADPLVLSEK